MKIALSTHVLDTARGVPAAGVAVALYAVDGDRRVLLASSITNNDGRTDAPLADLERGGMYELVFDAGAYFARNMTATFFDDIAIRFIVDESRAQYHVPLLLAPYGYTTYRGS